MKEFDCLYPLDPREKMIPQRQVENWLASRHHGRLALKGEAFVSPVLSWSPPTCLARRSGASRRPNRSTSKTRKPRSAPARLDPILNDGDIDTTDITTYVSCPTCFNSIMLRPEKLANGPVRVVCNCCEKATTAVMNHLENMDGSCFDEGSWRAARGGTQ